MNAKKRLFTRTGILATGVMLVMFGVMPFAQATTVHIGFTGSMGTGHASLTVGPDSLAGATPGDPSNAMLITNASGTFSNSTFGNVSITGVLGRNFATPFDVADGTWTTGDLPFPESFSQLAASGTSAQDNGVITYDDLFYADGSPQTCWDYPFFGGFLDPYGVMFSLNNGGYLDLWSFGVVPQDFFGPGSGGLTYGMAVLQLQADGSYAVMPGPPFANASVPEPNFLWLFGAAVLGLFAWRRSVEKKRMQGTD